MHFLDRLKRLFTKSGRDETSLLDAIEHAKAKRPEEAVGIYDTLLKSETLSDDLRARTLFNRALAHSSMKNDALAEQDLQEVLQTPHLQENVRDAARAQLARVRKRSTPSS